MSLAPPLPTPQAVRFRALVWSLLHVPAYLLLFARPAVDAVSALPSSYRFALWPIFPVQAAALALLAYLAVLPLSLWPRVYTTAVPFVTGLWTAVIVLDATVYSTIQMHLNGFVLRVLLQPNALLETGVPPAHVALFVVAAVCWVAVEIGLGRRFLQRPGKARSAWRLAAALLVLVAAERVYVGGLTFFAGPPALAASTVLPMQLPIRMQTFYRRIFGERGAAGLDSSSFARRAGGTTDVRFGRRPDVLFVVAESLPADHFDARTMPKLWARTERDGARFERHYASGVSTNFAVFSLLYAQHAHRLESVVGAGRRPLLFEAMRSNGYQVRVLSASCLDWMDLQELVFAGVAPTEMRNRCEKDTWATRDATILADAREMVSAAPPDEPLFVFLFMFGTHFNYFYPPSSAIFSPAWDGSAGLKTTSVPGPSIQNRARNAAHALDASLDEFLDWFATNRGRGDPLVVFTSDHGEEFRQKGHVGHGSALTREQLHVPFATFGPGVPRGTYGAPTSHVDLAPTLFRLLGDPRPPSGYSDGLSAFDATPSRFVIAGLGWEPRYAAIGTDLKVTMYAGTVGVAVTDPDDRPVPDGNARVAEHAAEILRAMRGDGALAPRAAATEPQGAGQ